MINRLYNNIAAGLKKIKPCTIYQEDVPQNFDQPSFLVIFYDQNPTRGINGRLNNKVRVDIAYFPEDERNANAECWEVGQDLTREFQLEDFKIKNRNLKVTDKVLHFLFDVDYREVRDSGASIMRELELKEKVKEE